MDSRVLVIGTTPDYIAHIADRYPGQVLFVSDRSVFKADQTGPADAVSEIRCDLTELDPVVRLIRQHCQDHSISPDGITCFDCEWLEMTARIADQMNLPYHSVESIRLCRDKSETRRVWRAAGVDCPRAALIGSVQEATAFVDRLGGPAVFKPLSGSGSELTFVVHNRLEAASIYHHMVAGLRDRADLPMFRVPGSSDVESRTHLPILAEEFAAGREYSCDLLVDHDRVEIIRVARKIMRPGFPFGTTLAYVIPGRLPGWLSDSRLEQLLGEAARALKLEKALCMVDFIVRPERVLFLELTPRPGGDCLPALIRHSSGLDMLKVALDFARQQPIAIPGPDDWRRLAGLRIFADRSGKLRRLDVSAATADPRVKDISLVRKSGDIISLPPDDYTTWLLGSIILKPDEFNPVETECDEICSKLIIDIEPYHEEVFLESARPAGRNSQTANPAT